jgi:hypothetical protein
MEKIILTSSLGNIRNAMFFLKYKISICNGIGKCGVKL